VSSNVPVKARFLASSERNSDSFCLVPTVPPSGAGLGRIEVSPRPYNRSCSSLPCCLFLLRIFKPAPCARKFGPSEGSLSCPHFADLGFFGQGLPLLLWPLLTSPSLSTGRPPGVRRLTFDRSCRIYPAPFRTTIGRLDSWLDCPGTKPYIRFLCVKTYLCIGLPSDSPSQGTPLPIAKIPVVTALRGLAPLSHTSCPAHQEMTQHSLSTTFTNSMEKFMKLPTYNIN
jgi:hypothetical protein